MTLKAKIGTELLKILFLKKIFQKCFNKIKVTGSTFNVSSVHFKKNTILLQKNNRMICGANSFMQNSMICVEGMDNDITIANNTEGYGMNIRIFGQRNQVIIESDSILRNSSIMIKGNNNKIKIGRNVSSYNGTFHMEQNGNEVSIGDNTTLHGRDYRAVNFELYEGCKIIVGKDCMFSNEIQIRPSDAHSLVDLSGKRLNPAEDIIIGDHCWICLGVTILKGTQIPEHTVVGAGAVCTKKYTESYCVLAGNPAKVVKQSIDWNRKFL